MAAKTSESSKSFPQSIFHLTPLRAAIVQEAWDLLYPALDIEQAPKYEWYSFKPVVEFVASSNAFRLDWGSLCRCARKNRRSTRAFLALLEVLTSKDYIFLDLAMKEALNNLKPAFMDYVSDQRRESGKLLFLAGHPSEVIYPEPCATRNRKRKFRWAHLMDNYGFRNNRDMGDVLLRAYKRTGSSTSGTQDLPADSSRIKRFAWQFRGYTPETIPWERICKTAKATKQYKWSLALLLELIEAGHPPFGFVDPNGTRYECLLGLFEKGFNRYIRTFDCEDPSHIALIKAKTQSGTREYFTFNAPGESGFLRGLLEDFFAEASMTYSPSQIERFVGSFQLSMAFDNPTGSLPQEISDFTDSLFWEQVRYFRIYGLKAQACIDEISLLTAFYRYLDEKSGSSNNFADCPTLSRELLYSSALTTYIRKGYAAIEFTPNMKIDVNDRWHREKIIFILRGYSAISTTLKNEDHIAVDFTTVESPFYRQEVMNYFVSNATPSLIARSAQLTYIAEALNMLSASGKPNDDQKTTIEKIKPQHALSIRNYFIKRCEKLSHATLNDMLSATKAFLAWENENGAITTDELAMDYLFVHSPAPQSGGKAVSDEDLAAVNEALAKRAKVDPVAEHCHTVFHIMLTTNMRPAEICSLTIDAVRPSMIPGSYNIYTRSKTSCGEAEPKPISRFTKALIDKAIERTSDLRAMATPDEAPYVFLQLGQHRRVAHLSTRTFRKALIDCCDEAGVPRFSPYNLRDTRATRAFERYLKGEYTQQEFLTITGHRKIDTDTSHYAEVTLESMLEATYGINVAPSGFHDFGDHLVDAGHSAEIESTNSVENNCGVCTSDTCKNDLLPCLVCKDFKTTVEHLPFFERRISELDEEISACTHQHDKEDLITQKSLYASYVLAILKRKEEHAC